jgi:hypothetical protein
MEYILTNEWIFIVIMIWTLPWKAYALWLSARRGEKKWFLVLLVLNTVAILDLYYIFGVAKKSLKDIARIVSGR